MSIDRNARKLLGIKINDYSDVCAQLEITMNPSIYSPIRAVNDNHALLWMLPKFSRDGIIVASFTKHHQFKSEADSSSDNSLEGQSEGFSNIRIRDLTVSSIAGVQKS